jgi:hypothetical protein
MTAVCSIGVDVDVSVKFRVVGTGVLASVIERIGIVHQRSLVIGTNWMAPS